MRIVVAPDKFKDCLGAMQVAQAIAGGLRSVDPDVEVDLCPVADGGEGTVEALVAATHGRIERRSVTGPLPGMKVEAAFGILGKAQPEEPLTAVVEMSAASGLHLLKPDLRNPMRTTTYGTGELLRAAADAGAQRIIVGIGGSATVDGGIGCAQAWGATIELDNDTAYGPSDRKLTGADVGSVLRVRMPGPGQRRARAARAALHQDLPFGAAPADVQATHAAPRLPAPSAAPPRSVEFIVACDVGNPLYGPDGAARIFGPQKGATPTQVEELDRALTQLAQRTASRELADRPGTGAAGGLGFAMLAYFSAQLRSGIEIVVEATQLRQRLAGADLCITGEGRLDAQSLSGKATIGVARACKDAGVPCIALCGSIGQGLREAHEHGLTAWFSICDRPMTLDEAVADAPRLLAEATENLMRARTSEGASGRRRIAGHD